MSEPVTVTVTVSPSRLHFAPIAERHAIVAFTSSDLEIPRIMLVPLDKPAQIRSLWAMLLEGGAETVPLAVPLFIFTFIYIVLSVSLCQLRAACFSHSGRFCRFERFGRFCRVATLVALIVLTAASLMPAIWSV